MNVLKTSLIAAALIAAPLAANAESNYINGAGSATARLDFEITVPRVLFLQVGTGTVLANDPTVDKISFVVPAANLGDGTVINGTGGDQSGGAVTARVIGNNGDITLGATTVAALNNGAGDQISFTDIATTATTLNSTVALQAPVLADGPSASVTVSPTTGKSIDRDAVWTFTYANDDVAAPGTYGGTNTQNSRVTYTATML